MCLQSKITHVIFDLDGVLLDTESINIKIHQKIWSRYGKNFTPELMFPVMGAPLSGSVPYLVQHFGMDGQLSVKEYCEQYNAIATELMANCQLFPGVMALVRHLVKHKIPVAICTSSAKIDFDLKMPKHKELLDLMSVIVVAGDDPEIKRGKPAPDPYLATMNRFKEKAENAKNVLVFEDSANGVRAAVAAGMQVIMIPDLSVMKPPEEVRDKIMCILQKLEDFKPESVGLPPYD